MDNYEENDILDALEEYLSSPPVPGVTDPISYWHALANRKKGKCQNALARMALDILSTPGTFVKPLFVSPVLTQYRVLSSHISRGRAVLLARWPHRLKAATQPFGRVSTGCGCPL